MADVYIDDTATGTNAGTSWTNAYTSILSHTFAAGDRIFIQGGHNETLSTNSTTTLAWPDDHDNPARVYGCKASTTNEPPQQSDLITAYDDANIPKLTVAGTLSATKLGLAGCFWISGCSLESGRYMGINDGVLEDVCYSVNCKFKMSVSSSGSYSWSTSSSSAAGNRYLHENCWFDAGLTAFNFGALKSTMVIIGGKVTSPGTNIGVMAASYGFNLHMIGVDISDTTYTTGTSNNMASDCNLKMERCLVSSGFVIAPGGTPTTGVGRAEMIGCTSAADNSVPPINYESHDGFGQILQETTYVRTDGATDGDTAHALEMIPHAAASTSKGTTPLRSPWLSAWVGVSATSITLYMLRRIAADALDASECWLEVCKPNESVGAATAQYDHASTREDDIGGTLTSLTGDASVWGGTGDKTGFKISHTIAPGYAGPVMVRVCYAPGSTTSLYVDPAIEVA